jgi:hypothetical protein
VKTLLKELNEEKRRKNTANANFFSLRRGPSAAFQKRALNGAFTSKGENILEKGPLPFPVDNARLEE